MASYVGHLHTRISEHLGISPITGKYTSNPSKSSVLSHSCASGHKVDFDDFKILSSCSDSYELMIHEYGGPWVPVLKFIFISFT